MVKSPMIHAVEDAEAGTRAGFDAVIDVRSPAEFAEDHVPGAISLPVLSDAQRAEVGAIYVQRSKLLARRIGAAYVSANIGRHLTGAPLLDALADREGAFHPLVYCWRGGLRSSAMATVLSQVGWRVGLLTGGYRTYRRAVVGALYEARPALDLVLLCGGTGSGKTAILHRLAAQGVQTLDLEALAAHRGSLFGDLQGLEQPSQKMFESRLLATLQGLDPSRPIAVEAESSRIGRLTLPPALWDAMSAAPCIEIVASLAVRVRSLAAEYGDVLLDPETLKPRLDRLGRHHGRERISSWLSLAQAGDAEGLARALIEDHYDPAYRRAERSALRRSVGSVELEGADAEAYAQAAHAIADRLGAVGVGWPMLHGSPVAAGPQGLG